MSHLALVLMLLTTTGVGTRRFAGAGPVVAPWPYMSGAITASGATVKARIHGDNAQLYVSTDSGMASPTAFDPVTTAGVSGVATFTATGLTANTQYYYDVGIGDRRVGAPYGQFKTLPSGAAVSFRVIYGACCQTTSTANRGTNHPIWDEIQTRAPHGLIHLGDIGYWDIGANNDVTYRTKMNELFYGSKFGITLRKIPLIGYLGSDHDCAGPNSDAGDAGNDSWCTVYRQYFPSYTLASATATDAVHHAFTWGRCRFVMTDLRTHRSANSDTDDASKTMMGSTQKTWFKSASGINVAGVALLWFGDVEWLGATTAGRDNWQGFGTERTELADYLKAQSIASRVGYHHGDTHSAGFHDGSGSDSDFATGTGAPIWVAMASPFDQTQSGGFGTYTSTGNHASGQWLNPAGSGYFMQLDITDSGGATLTLDYSIVEVSSSAVVTVRETMQKVVTL